MADRFMKFTTAERRGLIVILLIMAITVAISYFSARRQPATGQHRLVPDTVLKENIRVIKDTSSVSTKTVRPKKNKKRQKNVRIYEKRNPLSQPLPQL